MALLPSKLSLASSACQSSVLFGKLVNDVLSPVLVSSGFHQHFPDDSDGKESACNVRDRGSVPGSGRSPGGGHGNLLQYSCLENPHEQRSLSGYSTAHRHKRSLLWSSWQTRTWGQESMKRRWRKEGRGGPKSLVEQGYFIHGSMCLYIVVQGSFRQKNKVE